MLEVGESLVLRSSERDAVPCSDEECPTYLYPRFSLHCIERVASGEIEMVIIERMETRGETVTGACFPGAYFSLCNEHWAFGL